MDIHRTAARLSLYSDILHRYGHLAAADHLAHAALELHEALSAARTKRSDPGASEIAMLTGFVLVELPKT